MKLVSQLLAVCEIANHCPQSDSSKPFLHRRSKLISPFQEAVMTREHDDRDWGVARECNSYLIL
jgi:hypothetical protein